jgi:hypothetical protein
VYRDPMQRLNGSSKDSLEQTLKQRSIMDTREFRRRMENGRSNQVENGRMQEQTIFLSGFPSRCMGKKM